MVHTNLLVRVNLLIFGFAIRLEAKDIPLLVRDFDRSVLSQEYRDRLFTTNLFTPVTWQGNPEAALDRRLARVVVVIPPDFSHNLKADKSSAIQAIVEVS